MKKNFTLLVLLFISVEFVSAQVSGPTAYDSLDINNVNARINIGDMWRDLTNNEQKYTVPFPGNVNSNAAGALWIGGLDDLGILHVAAQTYRQNGIDFFSGPVDSINQTSVCGDFDYIWKVNRSDIIYFQNIFDSIGQQIIPSQIPASILNWPAKGNPYNTIVGNRELAPYFDNDGNNSYNPIHGDFPLIKGDQAVWMVMNDVCDMHTESGGLPLGIEIHLMAYAFASPSCLNSTTFYEYTILKKTNLNLHDVFVAFWVDAEMGCYIDDYLGCDTIQNMGIVYNADSIDNCLNGYGNQPPIIGYKVLDVSANQFSGNSLMTNFMYYNNDFQVMGNPENASQYYGYMKSLWKDSSHLINPIDSSLSNYAFYNDPSDATGWSECSLNSISSDKRLLVSSGPMNLDSGEIIIVSYAVIWTQPPVGTYPCPPFAAIDSVADCVQYQFDNNFFYTEISSAPTISSIKLYPNPASNDLIIEGKFSSQLKFSLLNVLGQEIKTPFTKTDSNIKLNVSALAPGFYSIVIHDGSKLFTGKFIKE